MNTDIYCSNPSILSLGRRALILVQFMDHVRELLEDTPVDDWDSMVYNECNNLLASDLLTNLSKCYPEDHAVIKRILSDIITSEVPSGRYFAYYEIFYSLNTGKMFR